MTFEDWFDKEFGLPIEVVSGTEPDVINRLRSAFLAGQQQSGKIFHVVFFYKDYGPAEFVDEYIVRALTKEDAIAFAKNICKLSYNCIDCEEVNILDAGGAI